MKEKLKLEIKRIFFIAIFSYLVPIGWSHVLNHFFNEKGRFNSKRHRQE
jgi:hypothetical protein